MKKPHVLVSAVLLGIFFISCLLAAPAFGADQVELKWKLQKGEKIYYVMSQESKTEVMGMEMVQDMTFYFLQEVLDVEKDGNINLKLSYERIITKMKGPGMDSEYDSDSKIKPKDDDVMSIMMGAFVGQSFNMKFTPYGEIKDVGGVSEFLDSITKIISEQPNGEMMAQMLKSSYNEKTIKDMMQQNFSLLPKEPIGVGGTWKNEGSFSMMGLGEMSLSTNSTLKEIKDEGKTAIIGQDITISFSKLASPMVEIKDTTFSSEITWKVDTGRMESMKSTMTMNMVANGQEMKSVINNEMKLVNK